MQHGTMTAPYEDQLKQILFKLKTQMFDKNPNSSEWLFLEKKNDGSK